MIAAIVLTIGNLVPRALYPLLSDRSGTIPANWIGGGVVRYYAVVALLAGIVALPFAIAIILALKSPPGVRTWRQKLARWLGVAIALACGLAILDFPLDGMRVAYFLGRWFWGVFLPSVPHLAGQTYHALP